MPNARGRRGARKHVPYAPIGVWKSADFVGTGKHPIFRIAELTRLLPRLEAQKQTIGNHKRLG
jgi:hypothetical protein